MNTYELYIFDFEGTIVDSRLHIANSVNFALIQNGFATMSPEEIYPTIGKLPIGATFKQFYPQLSVNDLNQLILSFRKYLIENVKKDLVLFP